MFYVETLRQYMDLQAYPWLPELLRLFNIRFLMSSGIDYDPRFVDGCMLQSVVDEDGFTVHQINTNISYGYFDFVRVPGAIYGDHKDIRETVLHSLPLVQSSVLLFINPVTNMRTSVHLVPNKSHTLFDWLMNKETKNVKWFFNGLETTRENLISVLAKFFSSVPPKSRVVQEWNELNSYEAVVHVTQSEETTVSETK